MPKLIHNCSPSCSTKSALRGNLQMQVRPAYPLSADRMGCSPACILKSHLAAPDDTGLSPSRQVCRLLHLKAASADRTHASACIAFRWQGWTTAVCLPSHACKLTCAIVCRQLI